jgi:hypothetical protein
MTQIGTEDSSTERTQRIYARVAGFLFLWLIITGLAGALTISHIVGPGTFAETAKGVVASECRDPAIVFGLLELQASEYLFLGPFVKASAKRTMATPRLRGSAIVGKAKLAISFRSASALMNTATSSPNNLSQFLLDLLFEHLGVLLR